MWRWTSYGPLSLEGVKEELKSQIDELIRNKNRLDDAFSRAITAKECTVIQQNLDLTVELLSSVQRKLVNIENQQAEMNAQHARHQDAKLAENEKTERSVVDATAAIREGWFSPELEYRGADQLPSFGDPDTKFNVRFDQRTKVFLYKKDKGVKTYAVRCQTVLGNDVVVLFEGNLIW